MIALALTLGLLAAPGDPAYSEPLAPVVLTGGQASQVATFVSTAWPGNPIATVQEVECWETAADLTTQGECRVAVLAPNLTAAELWERRKAGWVFQVAGVTKNALNDYTGERREMLRVVIAGDRPR